MTIKATVERVFQYTPIGKPAQTIRNTIARMEFPQAVELDDEIMLQVESFYQKSAKVADYEHDGFQTVIEYELGTSIVITYEEG